MKNVEWDKPKPDAIKSTDHIPGRELTDPLEKDEIILAWFQGRDIRLKITEVNGEDAVAEVVGPFNPSSSRPIGLVIGELVAINKAFICSRYLPN